MAKLEAPRNASHPRWLWHGDKSDTTNAVVQAKPLCLIDYGICPHTTLEASGLAVGLPEGQMGEF